MRMAQFYTQKEKHEALLPLLDHLPFLFPLSSVVETHIFPSIGTIRFMLEPDIVLDTCEAVAAAPLTVPMSVPPGAAVVEFKACDVECTSNAPYVFELKEVQNNG